MNVKKLMVGLLLMLLFCSVMTVSAEETKKEQGKTYYVSNSTGNDENDGTTEATAWKSLEKLSGLTLGAGDKVLLKCGDRWVGELLRLYSPTGTEDNPVILGSYGTGEKPKVAMFEDSVPKYQDTPLVKIENAENFTIDGLDIGFCGVGVDLHYYNVTNKKNVRIQNCHFHDIYGFYQTDKENITKYPHALGICVTSVLAIPGCSEPVIENLYIDKCTSYDAGALYSYGSRVGTASAQNVHNLYVTDCVMKNNGIYGIAVCDMNGGYMDNCKIIDCGSRYSPMGSMGIMCSGKNFTIMNSEIAYQQRLEDNPDGGGIDFEHLGYDFDVINCYIHDNSGVGVMMYSSGADASHQNKRVRLIGNVFENNNQNVMKPGGAEILSLPLYSLVDGSIYNNKYMKSENMFTMSIDASVNVAGNMEYEPEQKGTVWPIYDFDDVRAYVIDGVPLPDLYTEEDVANMETQNTFYSVSNYIIGAGGALVLIAIAYLVVLIVCERRERMVRHENK